MITRILTAILLAPIVLGLSLYLPAHSFGIALAVVAIVGLYEWNKLTLNSYVALGIGWVMFALLGYYGISYPKALLYFCIALSLYWIYQSFDLKINGLNRSMNLHCGVIEGIFLLVGFWAGLVLLHQMSAVTMIAAMMTVWAADSFAYFAGKSFGKRPLATSLSPKKTIEGLLGGLLGAVLVLCLFAKFAFEMEVGSREFLIWIVAGIAAALVSVVGDLFQSRLKRRAGVKDSGSILPGHGGILDRIDGLVAAMPVFASIWSLSI